MNRWIKIMLIAEVVIVMILLTAISLGGKSEGTLIHQESGSIFLEDSLQGMDEKENWGEIDWN